MGHADIQTTREYLHYAPCADDALLVAAAFATEDPDENPGGSVLTRPGTLGDAPGRSGT
jgi:hypothetical protein